MSLMNLFRRPVLVPYNFGAPDCPALKVGDKLLGVTENDSYNIIASSCGMDGTNKAGQLVKWKVKAVYDDGDALIVNRGNRALIKYMKWEDGNRVRVNAFPMSTTILIRFYKLVRP